MIKLLIIPLLFILNLSSANACTLAITIQDTIGAATFDLIQRASEKAQNEKCTSLFVRLNTPGGSLQSTRLITEHILASQIPFLCLISPAGGHAGSAGAIILQACHVSGGLPATNLGAATPVSGTGEEIPKDMRNKLINDTVSWLEGMTRLRERNLDFSKKIITEGKAVTSDEAVKMKALDILALTEDDFLKQAEGRSSKNQEQKELLVKVGALLEFSKDWRYKIIQFISEPELAYLFFMGALLLLYAELSNPGLFLPGVAGSILLILSLIAFHKLEATFGGQALLVLGLVFWVAELFIPSKGILGIAGTISIVIGSFLLFDAEKVGFDIPTVTILTTGLIFGSLSLGLSYLAARSLRQKPRDFDEKMKSNTAKVVALDESKKSGQVDVMGEFWHFESDDSFAVGEVGHIVKRKNLKVILKKQH
ncbi:MAG: NfeD family protein [Bdellovibrionales bacterium]